MKKNTGKKIQLGLFVTIGVLLLIAGIYLIGKRQKLFSQTFHVSCVFSNISGLQVGNNVRFSGINVGIVEDIEQISDTAVRVDIQIEKSSRKFIKKNAKATIGTDGLMGNKILTITPGKANAPVIDDHDQIASIKPVQMDEILANIKVTSDNAAQITSDLALLMENIREGRGTIGKLFMDSSLAEDLNQSVVNIKQGASGFKKNMDAASRNILLRGFFKRKKKEREENEKNKKEE